MNIFKKIDVCQDNNILEFVSNEKELSKKIIESKILPFPDVLVDILVGYLGMPVIINEEAWMRYLKVKVSKSPPLPKNLQALLQNPCPFFRGEKVGDTHTLLYLPAKLGKNALDIYSLQKVKRECFEDSFYHLTENIQRSSAGPVIKQKAESPGWIFISRELPNSKKKTSEEHIKLCMEAAKNPGLSPTVLSPVETVVFLLFLKAIYGVQDLGFTSCDRKPSRLNFPVSIGLSKGKIIAQGSSESYSHSKERGFRVKQTLAELPPAPTSFWSPTRYLTPGKLY